MLKVNTRARVSIIFLQFLCNLPIFDEQNDLKCAPIKIIGVQDGIQVVHKKEFLL